ncbi:MAG: NAD(P)/FAD-dependent oxidoreductase, partial [Actinobacteria bacterium]|nr:NAD(P)/FAD-dependent oxidoreductase [Actinomycetota bacterium]NIS37166.1 NAD(P)/FAD-dependent oxidoreductase [Actinomycetota bacterium]NIT99114.1 NAD(P)/FAD-dependent oxidoreductase [Actinomycetota bacterium]NIU22729.1 NAD(P)/FAD-dependent oxidoreductase [Actinomycetota bacterium]NIU71612.1 NAD(P)/FAD-dependent oxidoreductase [Actinomycetota bacterium]
ATGARCRTLPGTGDLDGVFALRDLDDSRAIREAFGAAPQRVVVVGA